MPILPPTRVFRPEAVSSSPSRVVVVVLPLVPLTARSGRRMKGAATSSSPTTGRPAARAAMSQGSSGGTPGDRTMASKPCQRGWATPRSSTTPRPWMSRRESARSSGGAWSVTVTRAPCSTRKRHRATPVRARPTTKIFWFLKSITFPTQQQLRYACSEGRKGDKGARHHPDPWSIFSRLDGFPAGTRPCPREG